MNNNDGKEIAKSYLVVVNHEEQYSIWPPHKEVPSGWRTVGRKGSKEECLAYIEEVWSDMRPLSLRKKMESKALSGSSGDDGVNI